MRMTSVAFANDNLVPPNVIVDRFEKGFLLRRFFLYSLIKDSLYLSRSAFISRHICLG